MSSSYICPHCGKSVTVKAVPIENCPLCGERVPDDLADEVENNFKPVRPFFLSFQLYLGLIYGVLMLMTIQMAFEPQDDSIYKMVNFPPPPHLNPTVNGVLACVQMVFLFWTSYLLYMQDYKSRMALMLTVFVSTVPQTAFLAPNLGTSDMGRAIFIMLSILSVLSLLSAYWYLYMWKYPKAYYESLRYIEDKARMNAERADRGE
jgi:hypothetical protein